MNALESWSRYLLALVACLALAGCAAPKSRQEVLATDSAVTRVCTGMTVPDAAQRLKAAWRSCFVKPGKLYAIPYGTGVAFSRSTEYFVGDEFNGDVTSLFVRIAPSTRYVPLPSPLTGAIMLMADIRETAECRAELAVRSVNEDWRDRAAYTPAWFREPVRLDQRVECP